MCCQNIMQFICDIWLELDQAAFDAFYNITIDKITWKGWGRVARVCYLLLDSSQNDRGGSVRLQSSFANHGTMAKILSLTLDEVDIVYNIRNIE